MKFDDLFGDGQSQAGAGRPALRLGFGLAKFFKNNILVLLVDTHTVVCNIHPQKTFFCGQFNLDLTILLITEFDGVGDGVTGVSSSSQPMNDNANKDTVSAKMSFFILFSFFLII